MHSNHYYPIYDHIIIRLTCTNTHLDDKWLEMTSQSCDNYPSMLQCELGQTGKLEKLSSIAGVRFVTGIIIEINPRYAVCIFIANRDNANQHPNPLLEPYNIPPCLFLALFKLNYLVLVLLL